MFTLLSGEKEQVTRRKYVYIYFTEGYDFCLSYEVVAHAALSGTVLHLSSTLKGGL
jgi:hypothetical protein